MAVPAEIRYVSVCSGVGLLDLGFRLAVPAARTILYCERESYCAAVLAKRMEEGHLDEAPVWSDLRTLGRRQVSCRVDAIIGGFPCQGFSVAGKRRMEHDKRNLWPEIVRLLGEFKPWLGFWENVPGIVPYLPTITADLQRLGYRVPRPLLLEAASVGAAHRRERIFIMAYHPSYYRGQYSEPGADKQNTGRSGNRARGGSVQTGVVGRDVHRLDSPIGDMADTGRTGVSGRDGMHDGGMGRETQATERQRQDSERQRLRNSVGDGEPIVADPATTERRREDSGRGQAGRVVAGGAGGILEHTERQPRSAEPELQPDGQAGQPWQAIRNMGDASGAGPQRAGPGTEGNCWAIPGPADGVRRVFAPGPSDPDWPIILKEHPYLAPAVEPGLRGLADGSAVSVDQYRVDQLRALGNGVVPLQSAVAFKILWRRLTDLTEQP